MKDYRRLVWTCRPITLLHEDGISMFDFRLATAIAVMLVVTGCVSAMPIVEPPPTAEPPMNY